MTAEQRQPPEHGPDDDPAADPGRGTGRGGVVVGIRRDGTEWTSQGPARGYAWKPFQPGHASALKSGWKSPRVYEPLAMEFAEGIKEVRPDLARPEYAAAVVAWAQAEAVVTLLRRRVAEVGVIGDDGEPRAGLMGYLKAFENQAEKRRQRLGLDPRSEAALAQERAAATAAQTVDLTALAEEGRRVLAEREARGELPPPDLAGEVIERVRAEGRAAMGDAAAARDTGTGTTPEPDRGHHDHDGLRDPGRVDPEQEDAR